MQVDRPLGFLPADYALPEGAAVRRGRGRRIAGSGRLAHCQLPGCDSLRIDGELLLKLANPRTRKSSYV